MIIFPTKDQLLRNFLSCVNWEEKYLYIIEIGKLLPKFPENFRTKKYLVTSCQSRTWIVLTIKLNNISDQEQNNIVNFYGDSDSAIIKGIILIIFSLYQNINIQSIINLNVKETLDQLELNQHLTISRSQGILSILNTINIQASNLLFNNNRH